MPPIVIEILIIAVLAAAVGFAVRSIWKSHKNRKCTGNCANCGCNCGK